MHSLIQALSKYHYHGLFLEQFNSILYYTMISWQKSKKDRRNILDKEAQQKILRYIIVYFIETIKLYLMF